MQPLASIPSPSRSVIDIGPLTVHAYGICIALGVVVAVWFGSRRWQSWGGDASDVPAIATWAVPAGVVGARLYHLATDWRSYRGRWSDMLKIGQGGLGIWGGVALGALAGVVVARRRGLSIGRGLDMAAPAIPLAQAIGRWGNWWNQELFGRPTSLPWAVEIDPAHRPAQYAAETTFHPTFLYESLWNLFAVAVVLIVEKRTRGRLRPGRLFAVYVATYTFGRFFIERVRIDRASHVGGLRINEVVALIVFAGAVAVLLAGRRHRADQPTDPPAEPLVDQTVANPDQ